MSAESVWSCLENVHAGASERDIVFHLGHAEIPPVPLRWVLPLTLAPKTLLWTNPSFGCLRIADQTIRQRPCILRADEAEDRLLAGFYGTDGLSSCGSQYQSRPTRSSHRCWHAGVGRGGGAELLSLPGRGSDDGAD